MPGDPQGNNSNNAWSGMGTGWSIVSTLLAGMLVFGALGHVIDLLAGTHKVFLGVGVVIGGIAGIYAVYMRYGKGET
jgi:ATP synthase protein I